jgi:hypothetical protein
MKKLSISLNLTLAAIAVATNIGCGGNGNGTNPDGGGGAGFALVPSDMGFFDGTNEGGVLGAWYSYGDYYNPVAGMGDCPTMGFAQAECSSITAPVPGQPFTNTGGRMCTNGTAAKVIMAAGGTTPAYSAIWGTGIGFDFNNGGTDDGGTGVKGAWDASAYNVTGFSFRIDMPPLGGQMRVEFPTNVAIGTTDINAAYWGGAGNNLSPITMSGDYSFKFTDVGGPMYLPSPMPFDKTKILSMQFHVVTNTSSTVPFDYCISNLRALTN